jgi:hypothetical protein
MMPSAAKRESFLDLDRQFGQHRGASAHVEATDSDLDSSRSELTREVNRACKLVGLHSDQTD